MSDSEEEYGSIAAAWGNQMPAVEPTKPEGWDSLIDPSVKVGPNDIGSGNLHRRGTNYKPINEELILAHRMNIQVPKKKMLEAIRATEATLGLPESKEKPRKPKKKSGKPTSTKPHAPNTKYIPSASPSSLTPSSSLSSIRPPPLATEGNSSSWLNTNLVDTPFWENKANTAPATMSSSKSVSSNDWALAVKEVTSDLHKNQDDSLNEWFVSSKMDKSAIYEKSKSTATVTWGSSAEADDAVNNDDISRSVRAENKWGSARTESTTSKVNADAGRRPTQPQSTLSKTKKGVNIEISGKTDRPSTNDRQTSRPTIAAANNDWGSASNKNSWGVVDNNDWPISSIDSTAKWEVDDANGSTTWNSFSASASVIPPNNNNNNNNQHIPSDKPPWLNSIPDKQPPQSQFSRFSNPRKQRYSESPIDIPEPVNYRRDGRLTPLRTAPPPPPENSLLITIEIELSDNVKVPVEIRELDDPHQLATDFIAKNNITAPNVIGALTKLITTQKETSLKKKNQRLQRRVQPKNYDNVYNNNPSKFSTYYSRSSSTAPSSSSSSSFTRKVYY